MAGRAGEIIKSASVHGHNVIYSNLPSPIKNRELFDLGLQGRGVVLSRWLEPERILMLQFVISSRLCCNKGRLKVVLFFCRSCDFEKNDKGRK